jgi:kynurenine formamidase
MSSESDVPRRSFLVGAIGAAFALAEKARGAGSGADADVEPPSLTLAEIDRMMTELSNWGRWGKDDQMGTVNLITPAKRKYAASLVREGITVSLAHNQDTEKFSDNPLPLIHVMNDVAGGDGPGFTSSRDTYTMTYHGIFYSHMDALCHFCYGRKLYNGYPSDVVTSAGASKLDITAFKSGIVTRGILMDIPRLKGVPYLEPGTPIFSEDLDAWERQAHIKVASGDMIFIRTGRWARRAEKGPWALNQNVAGLHATCARWLKQRDVAVLASDAVSDVIPSGVEGARNPIHGLVIVALGTPIFDNLDLEELSETANRLHRWEFMLATAPMLIPGGTGSPLNPVALF